jgi:RNA polymerase sigma-70 factor (ECF subfamily)
VVEFEPVVGEEIDWAKVWEIHSDKIYKYIYRRVSDAALTEDLTSMVFLKAMEATLAGKGWSRHFQGWLFRIAHNLIIDHYRARARTKIEDIDNLLWLRDKSLGPHDLAEINLKDHALRREMMRLTDEQFDAVAMRLDGYSFSEIGEHMDKTEGAVKALQHRAVSGLRYRLQNYEGEK